MDGKDGKRIYKPRAPLIVYNPRSSFSFLEPENEGGLFVCLFVLFFSFVTLGVLIGQ